MTKRLKLLLFIFAALIAITIDWQTKLWAKKVLFYIRSKTYFDGHFMLDYAENKGAALSFGANLPESQAFWVLQILPMVLLVLIVIHFFKNMKDLVALEIIGFAFIFGGGFANLVDRVQNKRHVIDFMIIEIFGFQTGIFNFADVFITTGLILLISNAFYSIIFNQSKINQ